MPDEIRRVRDDVDYACGTPSPDSPQTAEMQGRWRGSLPQPKARFNHEEHEGHEEHEDKEVKKPENLRRDQSSFFLVSFVLFVLNSCSPAKEISMSATARPAFSELPRCEMKHEALQF